MGWIISGRSRAEAMRTYLELHPGATAADLAHEFELSRRQVMRERALLRAPASLWNAVGTIVPKTHAIKIVEHYNGKLTEKAACRLVMIFEKKLPSITKLGELLRDDELLATHDDPETHEDEATDRTREDEENDERYGAKSNRVRLEIDEMPASFTLAELDAACPGVSLAMIRKVVREQRAVGRLRVTSRGRGARWEKT